MAGNRDLLAHPQLPRTQHSAEQAAGKQQLPESEELYCLLRQNLRSYQM